MKNLLWIFSVVFLFGYLSTTSWATEPPPINEMDALLKDIKNHTQAVGQQTKAAHEVSEKLVEEKAQEKAKLKEAVEIAEAKVEQLENVQEVYVAKMVEAGVDTFIFNAGPTFQGAIYDAFLLYQKNGGIEDFEYFRLYIYK